jgi:Spy/CpxP family protein refolding chaperone
MKKTVYALVAGAGLMVAGMMSASAETVVVQNVPNGTEVTVVAGPQVETLKQLVQKMDLTQEQKDKIKVVMQNADPKFNKAMTEADANSKALMVLCGDKYDAAKISTLADAQGKLVADAIKLRLAVRHDIYEILTPKQREDMKKFREMEMKEMQQQ